MVFVDFSRFLLFVNAYDDYSLDYFQSLKRGQIQASCSRVSRRALHLFASNPCLERLSLFQI